MARRMPILFFTAVLFVTGAVYLFAQDSGDEIVAEVNGSSISSFEVRREMNMMYQQAVSQGVYPDQSEIEAYWKRAVDMLIGRELLIQEAEAKNYTADQAYVDEYIEGLTINYGGIEKLEEALAQQGMTMERLRSDTARYRIVSDFVNAEFIAGIDITDQEAKEYYNENEQYFVKEETVRASHILIKTSEEPDEAELAEAYETISGLRQRITDGESFEDIAKEYSDCPSSERGGDLGEFGHGMMVPPFDRAAFALEPGELSQPVQTQFGYHLIKLTEKNADQKMQYQDVKQQIIEYLTNVETESRINSFVEELKAKSDIKIF